MNTDTPHADAPPAAPASEVRVKGRRTVIEPSSFSGHDGEYFISCLDTGAVLDCEGFWRPATMPMVPSDYHKSIAAAEAFLLSKADAPPAAPASEPTIPTEPGEWHHTNSRGTTRVVVWLEGDELWGQTIGDDLEKPTRLDWLVEDAGPGQWLRAEIKGTCETCENEGGCWSECPTCGREVAASEPAGGLPTGHDLPVGPGMWVHNGRKIDVRDMLDDPGTWRLRGFDAVSGREVEISEQSPLRGGWTQFLPAKDAAPAAQPSEAELSRLRLEVQMLRDTHPDVPAKGDAMAAVENYTRAQIELQDQLAALRERVTRAEGALDPILGIVTSVVSGPVHSRCDHNSENCNWCKLAAIISSQLKGA